MNVNPITQPHMPQAGSTQSAIKSGAEDEHTGVDRIRPNHLPGITRAGGHTQTGGPLFLPPVTHAGAGSSGSIGSGQEHEGKARPALSDSAIKSIVQDIMKSLGQPLVGVNQTSRQEAHPVLALPRTHSGNETNEATGVTTHASEVSTSDTTTKGVEPVVSAPDGVSTVGSTPRGITDKLVGQLLGLKDLNSDGVLTNNELNLHPTRFSQIDEDDDGQITGSELFTAIKLRFDEALTHNPRLDPEQFASRFLERIKLHPGDDGATPVAGRQGGFPPGSVDAPPERAWPAGSVDTPVLRAVQGPSVPPWPAGAVDVPPQPVVDVATSDDPIPNVRTHTGLPHAGPPASLVDIRPQLEEIALKIAHRLEDAGYTDKPPTNIRDIVKSLGLDVRSSNLVLGMMSAKYPLGLGIQLFG